MKSVSVSQRRSWAVAVALAALAGGILWVALDWIRDASPQVIWVRAGPNGAQPRPLDQWTSPAIDDPVEVTWSIPEANCICFRLGLADAVTVCVRRPFRYTQVDTLLLRAFGRVHPDARVVWVGTGRTDEVGGVLWLECRKKAPAGAAEEKE